MAQKHGHLQKKTLNVYKRVGGAELSGGWVLPAAQHTTLTLNAPPRREGRA